MDYLSTFERQEIKYILSKEQKEELLKELNKYMELDEYGRTTIRNIYYDTDNYRLIRKSLEKPVYKEKLRVRSYKRVGSEDMVFVELKKKYKSVVYKRRITIPEKNVDKEINHNHCLHDDSQIGKEIEYFLDFYETLHPVVFLSYEREAYYSLDGSDFRVTFDENLLYRENDLTLESHVYGKPILDKDMTLMEIKTAGAIPLWMCHILNNLHIYKTSFSKYGNAYLNIISENNDEEIKNVG